MFEFMAQLSESKLFPTVQNLSRLTPKQIADWTLMNLCALRVLLAEEGSHDWARVYARKTAQYGHFDKWRIDGTDLYMLLQSINGVNSGEDWIGYGLSRLNVLSWLKEASMHDPRETNTRRLFVRLDFDLKIRNEALRAIRRLTLDYHHIDIKKKQILVTRMLQFFRTNMRKSELLVHLERVARRHNLEIHDMEVPNFK